MKRLVVIALMAMLTPLDSYAVPFWGAKESRPPETAPLDLEQGEFVWNAAAATLGPILVLVSLDEQDVRALIQREIAGSGVMRVANTTPGLSPAVRAQLMRETESLVYERHKELWGQMNQFVTSVQNERVREKKEYQLEIGGLKSRVDSLESDITYMLKQQNAKGQQQ